MFTNYRGLDEVIAAMAGRAVNICSADDAVEPGRSTPSTALTVLVPGHELQHTGAEEPYTHRIHRRHIIGGEIITWLSADCVGEMSGGTYTNNPADDEEMERLWAEILDQLGIGRDPHQRPGQE